MNCNRLPALFALAALLAAPVCPGRADEFTQKGRAVFEKNLATVVTVQIVLKITVSASGRSSGPNETRAEVTGSVVDPSGLTVLALSSLDPSSLYDVPGYNMEIELSDVKILLRDGTELPAEVVLRDKDLDLAFVRPKTKPATPMPAIDLAQSASAQVLDQVITINRMGRAAGRTHAASVERISAVVQKPRLFYIPDSTMTATRQGSPAFTLEGKVLGLFVMRAVSGQGSGSVRDNVTSIIVPAEDILKAAKQAPEAKGGEEKKESS